MTMDDIAAQLGMSKKTLYAHFATKTALLEAVIQHKFADVAADLERVAGEHSADVAAAFRQTIVCMQRHVSELQPAFLRDASKQGSELFRIVEQLRREVIQRHFGTLLERGRASGVIRKDVPGEIVIQVLLGAVQSVLTPANLAELGLSPKEGVTAVVSVFLEGVLTDKGRAMT